MTMKKFALSATTIILLVLAGFIYWRYYFVYSEGTKAGILNTFQQKGFVFTIGDEPFLKTYPKSAISHIMGKTAATQDTVNAEDLYNAAAQTNYVYHIHLTNLTMFPTEYQHRREQTTQILDLGDTIQL